MQHKVIAITDVWIHHRWKLILSWLKGFILYSLYFMHAYINVLILGPFKWQRLQIKFYMNSFSHPCLKFQIILKFISTSFQKRSLRNFGSTVFWISNLDQKHPKDKNKTWEFKGPTKKTLTVLYFFLNLLDFLGWHIQLWMIVPKRGRVHR